MRYLILIALCLSCQTQASGEVTGRHATVDSYKKLVRNHWPGINCTLESAKKYIEKLQQNPDMVAKILELVNNAVAGAPPKTIAEYEELGLYLFLNGLRFPNLDAPTLQRIEIYRRHGRTWRPIRLEKRAGTKEYCANDPRVNDSRYQIIATFDNAVTTFDVSDMTAGMMRKTQLNTIHYSGWCQGKSIKFTQPPYFSVNITLVTGDVRPDGVVNSMDRIDVRNQLGKTVTDDNCRFDVDCNDVIDAADRVIVRDAM